MEDPSVLLQSHENLASPSLPTNIPYGQPLTNLSSNYSSNDTAQAYYRHVHKPFSQGSGYGMDSTMTMQSGTAGRLVDYTLPFEISSVSGHFPPQPTGMAHQSPIPMRGMTRPTSMQSVPSQENMLASPMQGVQGPATMFPAVFPSHKRAADGPIGMFGTDAVQESPKRPRLNVSIHATQRNSPNAQTSPHTLPAHMNATMTPLESAGINLTFPATVPISRTNSMVIPGHQSTPMNIYSPQMQEPPFAQHHPLRAPSNNILLSYDLQRNGSSSASNQNLPFMGTPYDRKISSTASSVGFPPSANSYGVKTVQEGFSPFHPLRQPLATSLIQHGHVNDGRFMLVVKQQPERARLCSFKEENDTIDRRPVDPPPIIQIIPASERPIGEMLVRHHFFMKAVLVAPQPDFAAEPVDLSPSRQYSPQYNELRLPAGQEATTGEATQTPEKLQDLEGKEGAFCVFGRLSIRMPGQFRLRFILYEATPNGVQEVAYVHSEPFEVFSPKLFGGMRQSTTLTRHFASQGFKIKLRQDGTGRSGRGKRAQPAGQDASAQSKRQERDVSCAKPQKATPLSRARKSSQVSPTTPSAPIISIPPSPAQRSFPSISTMSNGLNPYRSFGSSFATQYSMSSADFQNVPTVQPSSSSLPSPLHPLASDSDKFRVYSHSRPGTDETATKRSSDDTVSSIDNALDSLYAGNDSRTTAQGCSRSAEHQFRSTGVELPKPNNPGHRSATDAPRETLPSLNTAMQQSSVWLNNANLVPPDDMAGGITFRNGIRYGGDDGGLPPMSFGRLPNLIYEGLLPSTPGAFGGGNDLSNFSLKNGSGSMALTPYSLINGSAPATPAIPLNHDLTQYLGHGLSTGSRVPRSEGSSQLDHQSRVPPTFDRGYRPYTSDKPSQFADLDENPDAASAQGLVGFSSALSSSLECKVRNFNLELPRRASRSSRDSLDGSVRAVQAATCS